MPIIPMAGGTEGKLKIGGSGFSLAYAKSETTSKNNQSKKDWSWAQAVEHLPCKYEVLSSNSTITKKNFLKNAKCYCSKINHYSIYYY
jgi:hypothetical protein